MAPWPPPELSLRHRIISTTLLWSSDSRAKKLLKILTFSHICFRASEMITYLHKTQHHFRAVFEFPFQWLNTLEGRTLTILETYQLFKTGSARIYVILKM